MKGKILAVLICSLLVALVTGAASAAVITDTATVSLTATDWSQVISLQKFHGDISHLAGVVIKLEATGVSEIGYENRASYPADITLTWTATVTMKENGSTILAVAPSYSNTVTPAAFDGNFNWDGTSGDNFTTSDTKSDQITKTNLADYVGAGTFDLTILANAISQTIGSGNVASYYLTSASAKATVEYTTLPEPASVVALASGLIGIVGFGIRRRK